MIKHLLTLLASIAALTASAHADVPASCDTPHEIDRFQQLRRLSLDLRGQAPTIDEYGALETTDALPAATIAAWLKSDEFRLQMRRYHETLFWPNLSAVRLHGVDTGLTLPGGAVAQQIASAGRAQLFRGLSAARCDDYEQVSFDPKYPGEFRPLAPHVDNMGVRREGWRTVAPYWAPQTTVKVCAYDAQETVAATVNNNRLPCNSVSGRGRPECGCGPGLRFCYGPNAQVEAVILASLREQLGRAVDQVTTGGRPYTDLLLATRSSENGPIAFWRKYLAPNPTYNLTYNVPARDETLLDKPLLDATWVDVERPAWHAGVLTSPAFLLKFQTNRSRANRYRIDFLCEPFVPPAKPMINPGCSTSDGDLTNRCVCQYCHSLLEPMAAHFGQLAEAGAASLRDPQLYPRENKACIGSSSGLCGRFYVTEKDAHRAGSLLAYQYTDNHPDYLDNLDRGPRKLVEQAIGDGSLARCTIKRLFAWLVRRDLRVAGEATDELPLLEQLAKGFVGANYSLPWLVQQIVSLPQYRRAR